MNERKPDLFVADGVDVHNVAIRKTAHQKMIQNRFPATEGEWNQVIAATRAEFARGSDEAEAPKPPFSIF
jgi:hypothetical protein